MYIESHKRRLLLIVGGVFILLIIIVLIIAFIFRDTGVNQFGDRIRIQNYEAKVKNVSLDMRDATESYLYNIVELNSKDGSKDLTVNDAFIRNGSDSQDYDNKSGMRSGLFIVDMESIKQSFQVQYSYLPREDSSVTGGSPVVISCLPKEQLKYGNFNCKDFIEVQSTKHDTLLQYLPYSNFSFRITPDATQDKKMTLVVDLTIPQIDLSGDINSRREIVAVNKMGVIDWIKSKGSDPDLYIIKYNYTDDGDIITEEPAINYAH